MFIISKKQFFQVSHENASDTRSHFRSHGDTLFLREISAIEMKCINFKNNFNELEKGRRGYRLVTALFEKMFLAFKAPSCGIEVYKLVTSMVNISLVICVGWKFKIVNDL